MILEPVPDSELGEYRTLLRGLKVYGILRRQDLDARILQAMQQRRETEYVRIKKSRRWCSLPAGCPQVAWKWEVVFDFGPYKSTYNGPHDLPGGVQCDICHTWCRYGHLLVQPTWKLEQPLVGRECAILLSDLDPEWAEKKLAQEVVKRARALRLAQIEEENRRCQEAARQREEEMRRREQEAVRLQQEIAAQSEADEVAAAMLHEFARRSEPREERLVSCLGSLSPNRMPSDAGWRQWRDGVQRQASGDLREAAASALYISSRGNPTFRTAVAGVPVGGTVYRKAGGWGYMWTLPNLVEHSRRRFPSRDQAYTALIEQLEYGLRQYAESEESLRAYLNGTMLTTH